MQCEMTETLKQAIESLLLNAEFRDSMTAERGGEILDMPKTRKAKRLREVCYVPREITMNHQVIDRKPLDSRTRSNLS